MPTDWLWLIRPVPTAKAELVDGDRSGGRLALRMDAALVEEKSRDNHPSIFSKEFELPLGRHFRLSARMKATQPNVKTEMMLQSFVAHAYFWASSPNEIIVGTDWKDCEFVFKTPAPGDAGWHEQMKTFNVRVGFRGAQGSLFVDDITLKEIEMLDEWSSWQAMGMDRHSHVADPLFVDPANGDYRLRPESPAWKLGFQPIPFEKIGPYASEWRATWPIVEAEGAREKPLVSGP